MDRLVDVFPRNREHLSRLLTFLLVGRESRIAIRNSGFLTITVSLKDSERNVEEYLKNELDAETGTAVHFPSRQENVFLLNPPKFYFFSFFPFLIETSMMTVLGDVITVETKRYLPVFPHQRIALGGKYRMSLHAFKIHVPFLARSYSSRDGKQMLSFGRGHRIIATDGEAMSFVIGGKDNGLLAL